MRLFKTVFRCLTLIAGSLFFLLIHQYSEAKQFKALLFTKTSGWHHSSILEGVIAVRQLADLHHFQVDWHEDSNQISSTVLQSYDVVIFLSTTGDILNSDQEKALQKFVQAGKGFVGVHSAADTEHDWPWYRGLIGHQFVIHPPVQTARLTVVDPHFPGVEFMPNSFLWTDEYYHFTEPNSKGLNYVLTVDESSYSASAEWGDTKVSGMGKFHPLAWYQNYDGGRSFYTALGHLPSAYKQPLFLSHLYGGIYWAATGRGFSSPQ